eukprot:TRINITY_DN8391_c0_g1_i1.p1 TRINITY_DN8391_c0_g1~~TRINITY_DN8391_c0_g1_i1.p1  ORF type:complete len:192 (-),score=26.42 TRINITY_DN8391_c0_g1_i1:74-649(-)
MIRKALGMATNQAMGQSDLILYKASFKDTLTYSAVALFSYMQTGSALYMAPKVYQGTINSALEEKYHVKESHRKIIAIGGIVYALGFNAMYFILTKRLVREVSFKKPDTLNIYSVNIPSKLTKISISKELVKVQQSYSPPYVLYTKARKYFLSEKGEYFNQSFFHSLITTAKKTANPVSKKVNTIKKAKKK